LKSLKIGFIGSGFIAHFLAKAMKQVRRVELTAIFNNNGSEDLAAFAKTNKLGQPVVCDTIREVCEKSDAVAILTPNFTRIKIMQEIAESVLSGVPLTGVICEKPLARTIQEATEMVDLAASANLLTAYFENQLHAPAINKALKQLEPQMRAMGNITLARSTEEHSGPHSTWFWDPMKQGGGVLSDMGCHSIAASRHILTPPEKGPLFLEPVSVQADTSLLKWGREKYRKQLKEKFGVDYSITPAEDFCTGTINYKNPETGRHVKSQFTVSWMYDKQGLRILMEGLGPGYAFEMNSLRSPSEIFIGDEAAEAVADSEEALEKSTSSRGLLPLQPNEADLYGYVAEIEDMRDAFLAGKNAMLDWNYGKEITMLCQACYLSAEKGQTVKLSNPIVQQELETYRSLISRGEGAEVLLG
jgi:predicted dehydrogenase